MLKCTVCGQKFKDGRGLSSHLRTKHSGKTTAENKLNEIANSIAVESIFSTYILLNSYLSPDIILKTKAFHTELANDRNQGGLLQGYKVIIVATLDAYIHAVVECPEVLGIEPDADYRDYWFSTKGRGREITRAAVRTEHYMSQFVEKVNLLIRDLISLKTWDDIESFEGRTCGFRDCLCSISTKAYVAFKDGKKIPVGEALLDSSTQTFWSTSGDPMPIAYMYTDHFIGRGKDDIDLQLLEDMVSECNPSSGLTRLDYSRVLPPFVPKGLPQHWALGYAFTLHESLKQLTQNARRKKQLESIDAIVRRTGTWHAVDRYSRKLIDVYGPPSVYSGYSYRGCSTIPNEGREPL